jgi:hypothetical protein
MNRTLILLPAVALVFLTAMVWCWMYYTRITEIRRRRISVQDLAQAVEAKRLLKNVAGPSDNLVNLFEIPVLFYLALIILYVTDLANGLYLGLAWTFVLLRYVHSLIHVNLQSSHACHRFAVYFAATLLLWMIWAILGGELVLKTIK